MQREKGVGRGRKKLSFKRAKQVKRGGRTPEVRTELTGGGVSPGAAELGQNKDQEALSLPVPLWEGKSRHQQKCVFMSAPSNRTPCSEGHVLHLCPTQ